MCLILFAYRVHPVYRLVLAANRDEFYRRPTEPAQWWEECPALLGGRDLQGGGSWLALDRRGRLAALTNVRSPAEPHSGARSRGMLVSEFLLGSASAASAAEGSSQAQEYAGFNLLLMDPAGLYISSNRGPARRLSPGGHGLSNAQLDTPWPKVVRGRERLAALLQAGELAPEPLLALLADEGRAADAELPQTGVGLETERLLSAIFIRGAEYGTRSSTVVLQRYDGATLLVERTFTPGGELGSEVGFVFAAVPF